MRNTTILIPTSPIPSCPSTHIIMATIRSIREQLSDASVIVTADGGGDDRYREYVERLTEIDVPDLIVIGPAPAPVHQSGMLGTALDLVRTPLVYYLEHDWLTLPSVPWSELSALILSGRFNYLKLHAAPRVSPAHEHMMRERVIYHGLAEYDRYNDRAADRAIPVIKTVQWSQNPHLASTEFYRSLNERFIRDRTDFIENLLHGIVGGAPWEEFKLGIYNPMDGDMFRVYHLDGKGSK